MTDLTSKAAEIRAGLEGLPASPWAAYMDRYEVRVAASFIGDQEIIAMCATGRNAGKRAAHIARLDPATVLAFLDERASLLALTEQQAAELAEARDKIADMGRYMVPLHKDGTHVFIDGPGDVELDHGGKLRAERAEHLATIARLEGELRLGGGIRECPAPAWLPIETAPTDYTHVIGMDAKGGVSRTWFFAPSSMTRNWLKVPGRGKWKPVYWMPLREPEAGSGQNLADANSKSPDSTIATQSERIAALEAALKPFAQVADTEEDTGRDDPEDDRILVVQAHGCQLAELTVEDFRRARALTEGGADARP